MRKKSLNELGRLRPEAFKEAPKQPVVLVLDNIRSALNVGSAFRTADAFAITRVVLTGITARPPHREILKTAIGATESVDWTYFEDTVAAIEALRREGYVIWAVEQAEGSTDLRTFQREPDQKVALIFGNEVTGVTDAAMEWIDGAIEVPQFGTKHSLNVSVCVGVVLWAVLFGR